MLSKNSRIGLVLFGLYLLFYGSFVLLAAFVPGVMETPLAGVNLAIWSGFGLIAAALLLALVYGWARRPTNSQRVDAKRSVGDRP
jgi:uncharacterized membrane protein (DUF485 family)